MSKKVIICGVDTSTLPRITAKASKEMLLAIKKGDKDVRERFIYGNLRLVLSVVQRYSYKKTDCDDLFQIGCVGLCKAVDNFNTDLDVKFSTYAVPMIIGEIRRYLRESNSLRISRSIRDTAYQVLHARELLESYYNKEISLDTVAEALDIPLSRVVYCLDAVNEPISLYEPAYNDESDTLLYVDQIADNSGNDAVLIDNIALQQAINLLSPREKLILDKRFYQGKTQMEVSNEVGISQAQVSRLEKNAIAQIRQNM